ncbi:MULTISPECIES: ATP-binding cassette domain-containing protein [unclassified Rhodococcus (in: high G+C Gram-positive bacteria)]|uniref:ATP-binding cassette domain-containing protein n=1 Tax=unclassified Rhodococcus (in: high G+C Gram-positive bacteria) TaxID=192944 RepID=UPI00077AC9B5|nr:MULTISPECIES: ATP-binding cassette domain-containing protein [unclassified Rhodococcus (in: high G+C Gram-positive bacteria)]KXX62987.1 multidrug ABC transporter ATP-binding protein [Rhodococcus sp. LB1]PBC58039.1 multidrug ABC transporter ATP-binding protein [Rhodococcus sp. ACPA1]
MSAPAVVVEDLHVAYGKTWALDGVDLTAAAGTTLGVLGHNGAGKTTLIRTLTTLVRPTVGRVQIEGLDIVADADQVRRRIGVTGQYAGLDEFLTARENLELIGRLTGLRRTPARARADALIDRLGLDEYATRRVGELSGGSRRRIDLAASLVGSPSVLFLDEPTTGLDPIARAGLWDVVDELTEAGTTVVLTTQYLEEADRLADHIVVLRRGRVAARGTPAELKRIVGGKVVSATVPAHQLTALPFIPDTDPRVDDNRVRVSVTVDDAPAAITLVADLHDRGIEVTDLDVTSPSLDDVFTHLTHTTGAHK